MKRRSSHLKYVLLLALVIAVVAVTSRLGNESDIDVGRPKNDFGKTLAVRQDFFDCGGGAPSEISQWTLDGDFYVSGTRSVHKSEIRKLRKIVLSSRDCSNPLDEFETKLTLNGLTSEDIAAEYPWVKAAPPLFTLERLTDEARDCLAAGQVAESTSSIKTDIFLGGQPPIRLRLDRADERWESYFAWSLPEWEVSVGHQTWKSQSPRIAQALLPLMEDKDTFVDLIQWPKRFTDVRIAEIGYQWAANQASITLKRGLGPDYTVKIRTQYPGMGHLEARIGSRQPSPLSAIIVFFELKNSPEERISELVSAIKKAESYLEAAAWLRDLATDGTATTQLEVFGFGEEWKAAGLKGEVAYSFFIQRDDNSYRVLVGPDDPRALVENPTRFLEKYVTLPKNFDPSKALIVSPDGSAHAI